MRHFQIGRSHCGEEPAVEPLRRISYRHALYGGLDLMPSEVCPVRFASPPSFDAGSRKPAAGGRIHFRRRQLRNVALDTPVQKIEDIVLRRIDSGRERRPRDWGQHGKCRSGQAMVAARRPRGVREVGSLPSEIEPLRQARIQKPSKPMNISFRICTRRRARRYRIKRPRAARNGQIRIDNKLTSSPSSKLRSEPAKANPAPGPIYARYR